MLPASDNRLFHYREVAAVFLSSGMFFGILLGWAWIIS
jgi:hypothetical protein